MGARGARLARGWTGASAATLIAMASHTVAGGPAPGLPILVLSLALSGLVCTALAGKTLSLWRLGVAVVVSQGLFHGLFSMGAGSSVSPPQAEFMLHAAHAARAAPSLVATAPVAGMSSAMDHSSPAMWIGHGIAAVLTVVFLRRGEVAGVRIAEALTLRVTALLPLLLPLAVEAEAPVIPARWPVRRIRNLGVPLLVMRHRGPPVVLLAL